MKAAGYTLLGIFLALLSLTFITPGYLGVGFLGTVMLFGFFFRKSEESIPFAVGFTLGLELLGTHRFGTALLCTVVWYGLYLLFCVQLRFTSPYARFIVAMLIGLAVTNAILYPLQGYGSRALGLALIALLVAAGGGALLRATETRSSYELL